MDKTKEVDDAATKGPNYLKVLSTVPEDLRPVYTELVEDYKFHALTRSGRVWVSYEIIADLVKAGWRRTK